MDTKNLMKNKTAIILGCVLLLIAVAASVFAITATTQNSRNETKIKDLEEKVSEKDQKITQLSREAAARRKLERQPDKTDTESQKDEEAIDDEETTIWNDLYNNTVTSYTTAHEYIYIPQINKKLKIDDNFANVKYSFDRYGITVWAVAKDDKDADYDFANPEKNMAGIGAFSIYGESYREKWSTITNQLFTDNYGHNENFILESKGNHLTYTPAVAVYSEGADDTPEVKAELDIIEKFAVYVGDANNYENI